MGDRYSMNRFIDFLNRAKHAWFSKMNWVIGFYLLVVSQVDDCQSLEDGAELFFGFLRQTNARARGFFPHIESVLVVAQVEGILDSVQHVSLVHQF
jgi:hypothetical protein